MINRPTVVLSRENSRVSGNIQEIDESSSSQAIIPVAVEQVNTIAQVPVSLSRAIRPFVALVTPVAVVQPLRETGIDNVYRNYPDRPENQNQPIAGPSNTRNRRSTGINLRGHLLNTRNQRPLPPPAELEYDEQGWPMYDERIFEPNDE